VRPPHPAFECRLRDQTSKNLRTAALRPRPRIPGPPQNRHMPWWSLRETAFVRPFGTLVRIGVFPLSSRYMPMPRSILDARGSSE
jgi:hypothetical protein